MAEALHRHTPPAWQIRDLCDEDAASWVRCRALSFLASSYFDDVKPQPTQIEDGIRLVVVRPRPEAVTTPGPDQVVGILDLELFPADADHPEPFATIDTVAVHPDHQRQGIADALLEQALSRLAGTDAVLLDAWTREDEGANGWYQRAGFTEQFSYVYVYKQWDDPDEGFTSTPGLSAPVTAFAHGKIEDLRELRSRFARVHVCRQYARRLRPIGE